MEQEIYKGAAANDKTGTPARQAADIINGNFRILENKINAIQQPDGVLKSGEIETTGLAVHVEENAFAWRVDGIEFLTPSEFDATLDAATDDYYRIDALLGNNAGGYNIFKGDEDAVSATPPTIFPVGTVMLGLIYVFGATTNGSFSGDKSEPYLVTAPIAGANQVFPLPPDYGKVGSVLKSRGELYKGSEWEQIDNTIKILISINSGNTIYIKP